MTALLRILLPPAVLIVLAACSTSRPSEPPEPPRPSKPAATVRYNKALHDELVGMLKRDQSENSGGPQAEGNEARTARLKKIIEQYGWPTISLVGKDGEDAAWAIAQHSDFDPAFQQQALELLRDAVAAGEASPGNLAYLEDRVAVANGQPQVYGTQIRCGPDGPVPATPIKDEAGVEDRRAAAGLDTLVNYLAEMTAICAQDEG